MIAKHIPIRVANKKSYSRLIDYLVNKQTDCERVGRVTVSNCDGEEPISAVAEIAYTQSRNTRAKSDKTYHLVISFDSGEKPHDHVLDDIERELCLALGFEDHQRISVAHTDTEHFHIHLAINKIHPTKFTMNEPYRDFWKLGQACQMLEARHGLSITNHQTHTPGVSGGAANIDHHAQMQSLQTWMKANVLLPLQGCDDWEAFHTTLKSFGLEIVERGNGLVFRTLSSEDAVIAIKASSIDRSLSKGRLVERMGEFVSAPNLTVQVKSTYKKKLLGNPGSTNLFEQYKSERTAILTRKNQEKLSLSKWKTEGYAKQKQYFMSKKRFIKTAFKFLKPQVRYLMIKSAFSNYQDELEKIKIMYSVQNNNINITYNTLTWRQWHKQRNATHLKENQNKNFDSRKRNEGRYRR